MLGNTDKPASQFGMMVHFLYRFFLLCFAVLSLYAFRVTGRTS